MLEIDDRIEFKIPTRLVVGFAFSYVSLLRPLGHVLALAPLIEHTHCLLLALLGGGRWDAISRLNCHVRIHPICSELGMLCFVLLPNLNGDCNGKTCRYVCLPDGVVVVCTIPVVMMLHTESWRVGLRFSIIRSIDLPGARQLAKSMLREIDFQPGSRFSIIDFLITQHRRSPLS